MRLITINHLTALLHELKS